MKIYIDYDNNKLKELSDSLYELFKNNYDTIVLDNNISINEKINIIKDNPNSFTISNKINNIDTIEIVYPLRKSDLLAKDLASNLDNYNIGKYYQLRDSVNTSKDYYEILRDINNNSILIKYGNSFLNNKNIPNIIYQTINSFLGNSNTYVVKSGDSLYSIARRFNTTVNDIKKINNLTSNNLSINQKLIIPQNNTNNNDNNNDDSNESTYIVQSGDSLYSIARRFNTTVDSIKNANNLTSNILSINQKLIIPQNNTNSNNDSNENTYIVQSGDSLYSIARRFNTTVNDIININNLTSNLLSIGQKLIIPNNNQTIYIVQSGDNLYSIARRFNTSVDTIKKNNNLTSNLLSIGQKLIIK